MAEPAPTANEILDSVRLQQSRRQIDLQGQLRQDAKIVPFHLVQNGPGVRYIFSNPDQELRLQLGDKESRLMEISRAGSEKVTPRPARPESPRNQCHLRGSGLEVPLLAERRDSGHGEDQQSGLLEIAITAAVPPIAVFQRASLGGQSGRSADADGRLRLERSFGEAVRVVSAQKINDRWYLKQMRIEQLQPGNDPSCRGPIWRSRSRLETSKYR